MMRRTVVALLTSSALLLALAAPSVFAAEPSAGQSSGAPTKTKAQAKGLSSRSFYSWCY
jgi:hypothetical protein